MAIEAHAIHVEDLALLKFSAGVKTHKRWNNGIVAISLHFKI